MAKFNFNLRNPQKDVKENLHRPTPINFIIRWNNHQFVYSTGLSILPKHWQNDKSKGNKYQRAKGTLKEHAEFNSTLDSLLSTARETFNRCLNEYKRHPSPEELKESLDIALKRDSKENLDFFAFFEKFIKESELKTNDHTKQRYSKNTIGIYKTALKHLRTYCETEKKKIDFDTIDLDFYFDYNKYLTEKKKFSENNKGKLIKVIKTVLNDATERGINKNLSYKSKRFKVVSEDVENIYLDEFELREIYSLDLSDNKRLEKVRDLFYIGCVTGLRFSDLSQVKKDNIEGNRLRLKTIKTGDRITVHLRPEALAIIQKYGGIFPPSITNQKMNEYLKEICSMVNSLQKKVEINRFKNGLRYIENIEKHKLVTTHTARRSFATNSYKMGIPVNTIMGITGHKKESSFLNYIKMNEEEKADIYEMYLNLNTEKLVKVI